MNQVGEIKLVIVTKVGVYKWRRERIAIAGIR